MDDIVTGHFSRRAVHDDPFEDTVSAQDQIDHSGQVHDLRAGAVSGSNQCPGGMRRIDHIHAVAFLDLFARHTDFLKDLVRRSTDGSLVHQVAAGPKASAQRKTLLDDERFYAHPG